MATPKTVSDQSTLAELLCALQQLIARDHEGDKWHTHVCGGCRHEWAHEDALPKRCSEGEFDGAHMCPECGAEQRVKARRGLTADEAAPMADRRY